MTSEFRVTKSKNLTGHRSSFVVSAAEQIAVEMATAIDELRQAGATIISATFTIASLGETNHTPTAIILYTEAP